MTDGLPPGVGPEPVGRSSLRSETAANLSYNIICRALVFLFSSATSIILARHLSSSDYGIVGFAGIFAVFLGYFDDLGVSQSIVQKETIGENELYTAFTLKVLLGLFIFAVSYEWGSISQKAFDNPAVKAVVVVLASSYFINAIGFVPTTILTRALKFKRLTVPQIGGQLAATAVALTAVYMGFRYWSIVLSSLASCIASAVIVYALCPVPLRLKCDRDAAKEHLKFGSHLFFAGLMGFVLFNSDNFVIGVTGGAAMLGFYSIAFNWSSKASALITDPIQKVLLSTFSRLQHQTDKLRGGYLAVLEYVSLAAVLANVLLLILSRELLILVLGGGTAKWLPALTALRILCVYGCVVAVLNPVESMVTAIGRPALVFKSNAVVAGSQIACLYPAIRYFGLEGVAFVVTFSYGLQFLTYFPVLRRELDLSYGAVFGSARAALLSGCALAAFGFALNRFLGVSWFSLIIKLVAGSALYLAIFGCLTKWKIVGDAREIADAVLLRPDRYATRSKSHEKAEIFLP